MAMKFILLFAIVLFQNLVFSQNVLFLKNGDKMNGKLTGFVNDSVIYTIQGNALRFKTSEIISIYFEESLASYGDKPDVGSEVYIVDVESVPDFSKATVDSFYYASFYRNIYLDYKSRGRVPENIMTEVNKYNAIDKDAFNALDKQATTNLLKIEFSRDAIKTTVDGSGNYSAKLKPGSYYVYIQSNNREEFTMTERMGKIYCARVTVKAGADSNVSCNFDLN
jgi:hypothetical protein